MGEADQRRLELVRRARLGATWRRPWLREDAYTELMSSLRPYAHRIARTFPLVHEDDADSLFGEALLQLVKRHDGERPVEPLFVTIYRLLLIDANRNTDRRRRKFGVREITNFPSLTGTDSNGQRFEGDKSDRIAYDDPNLKRLDDAEQSLAELSEVWPKLSPVERAVCVLHGSLGLGHTVASYLLNQMDGLATRWRGKTYTGRTIDNALSRIYRKSGGFAPHWRMHSHVTGNKAQPRADDLELDLDALARLARADEPDAADLLLVLRSIERDPPARPLLVTASRVGSRRSKRKT